MPNKGTTPVGQMYHACKIRHHCLKNPSSHPSCYKYLSLEDEITNGVDFGGHPIDKTKPTFDCDKLYTRADGRVVYPELPTMAEEAITYLTIGDSEAEFEEKITKHDKDLFHNMVDISSWRVSQCETVMMIGLIVIVIFWQMNSGYQALNAYAYL